jgi:NAD(P)H-hydrate epimerase
MYLVTAEEMRAFDATAITDYGIPGVVLMENAGRTTFHLLRTYLHDDLADMNVAIIAGPGNNGGDGYVIARYLINYGANVHTFLLAPRDKIKGDALINLQVLEKMTSKIFPVTDEESLHEAVCVWQECNVILDAMLGTGLSAEVRSPYREAIAAINECAGLKVAVDLPSGLDADTGQVLGEAVHADLTVTYGFKKLGMVLYPGAELCGTVEVVDISIPRTAIEDKPPRAVFYNQASAPEFQWLREDPQGHKGIFGHLLIVGGSPGKTGAPAMTAMAASRIGAGLVTVATPASLNPILETKLTEEMTQPLPETLPGFLGLPSLERILDLADGKRCLAVGPGMSVSSELVELLDGLLSSYEGWMVIDADGLNALSQTMDSLRRTKAGVVLTPHPGEMARLTGKTSKEVQDHRVELARSLASEYGVWVVLKGARTITSAPDGKIWVNATGNPWMASGGQGDALTGILSGLLVQGLPPEEAIPFGVYLHGLAADHIIEHNGPAPVTATDVINGIPHLLGVLFGHEHEEHGEHE